MSNIRIIVASDRDQVQAAILQLKNSGKHLTVISNSKNQYSDIAVDFRDKTEGSIKETAPQYVAVVTWADD